MGREQTAIERRPRENHPPRRRRNNPSRRWPWIWSLLIISSSANAASGYFIYKSVHQISELREKTGSLEKKLLSAETYGESRDEELLERDADIKRLKDEIQSLKGEISTCHDEGTQLKTEPELSKQKDED